MRDARVDAQINCIDRFIERMKNNNSHCVEIRITNPVDTVTIYPDGAVGRMLYQDLQSFLETELQIISATEVEDA